jgi:hypothetical protein
VRAFRAAVYLSLSLMADWLVLLGMNLETPSVWFEELRLKKSDMSAGEVCAQCRRRDGSHA